MLSIRKMTWASSPTGRLSSVSPVTPAQETSPYTVISRVVSPARDSRAPWPGSSRDVKGDRLNEYLTLRGQLENDAKRDPDAELPRMSVSTVGGSTQIPGGCGSVRRRQSP